MTTNTKSRIDESTFLIVKDRVTNNVEAVVSPSNFQVGLTKSPADATLRGRFSINVQSYVSTKKNSWSINIDDSTTLASIEVSSTDVTSALAAGKTITVYLPPSPRDGQLVSIKDFSGVAGDVEIRIYDARLNQIDGENYKSIKSTYGSLQFCWQGSRWICIKDDQKYFANFYDDSDQLLTGSGVSQRLDIQNYTEAYGISLVDNSKITFNSAGVYNVTYSLQFENQDSQPHTAYIWLTLNGSNIPHSTSRVDIPGRKSAGIYSYVVGTVPWISSFDKNDYVQVYWTADDTNVSIQSFPSSISPSYPENPGVIVTAQQI